MRCQAAQILLLFALLQRVANAAEFPQLVGQFRQQVRVLRQHFLVRDHHSLRTLPRNVEHDAADLRRALGHGQVVRGSRWHWTDTTALTGTQFVKYNDDRPMAARTFCRAR